MCSCVMSSCAAETLLRIASNSHIARKSRRRSPFATFSHINRNIPFRTTMSLEAHNLGTTNGIGAYCVLFDRCFDELQLIPLPYCIWLSQHQVIA